MRGNNPNDHTHVHDDKGRRQQSNVVGVDLVTLSEAELAIAEDWLRDETRGIALPAGVVLASLRDRAASIGAAVGTKRLCVTCSASSGAVLWCQGGRRPNGMRKPDLFFECAGCVVESVGGEGAVANVNGAGEAFLAALVAALLVDNDAAPRALEKACALRAYVASSESATPPHSAAPLELRDRFTRKRAEEEQPLQL